jgi:hypothetical protein
MASDGSKPKSPKRVKLKPIKINMDDYRPKQIDYQELKNFPIRLPLIWR